MTFAGVVMSLMASFDVVLLPRPPYSFSLWTAIVNVPTEAQNLLHEGEEQQQQRNNACCVLTKLPTSPAAAAAE